jgi:polyhydroxyalkanoate synthesis regulator phasin
MEPFEIEIPALNVEKATKVVQEHMKELEELKSEELTDKQTKALIKFTQELTSQTETEI